MSLTTRLYSRLPISLQNVAFSAWGMKTKRERYGGDFAERLRWLKTSEWWSASDIEAYQNEKLREVVRLAYDSVPYYREVMKERGLRPEDIQTQRDLGKLPILQKPWLRQNAQALRSNRYATRQLRVSLTSGTTGSPLRVYLAPAALRFQWAVWWRHRARFGLRLGDKFLMFGARLPVPAEQTEPPFWRHNRAINQVYLSTPHLTPATMPAVVDWLNREDFDFYAGYPSAMYVLAEHMRGHGLRLLNRPKYIVTGSDALLPASEAAIGKAFGVPVTEQYGMAEACGNLAKCEYGRFHLDFEFCILELLPVPGVDDPDVRRLVFTGLANPAMPFIRYDIGDYGRIAHGPCPCGRQSLSLEAIDGRVEDYVRTPDGRRIVGMNQVFEWAPGVSETQIVQRDLGEIEVRIVPGPQFDRCRDETILESELRKRLGDQMHIRFAIVDAIPRTDNGKFRAVVSEIPPDSDAGRDLRSALSSGTLVNRQ